LNHAKERVAAAVEAARKLPFPFMMTARAENFLRGITMDYQLATSNLCGSGV
jgi:2-methylisocitrate lyase-like PEP mutase family enzyme